MRNFFDMSSADIDRAVEAHWDREWERLNAPDAWEHDSPDWMDVMEIIDARYSVHEIADLVRDLLEGDGDRMLAIYRAGLLDEYIDPAKQMKDPDEEWDEVDRVFTEQWDNDTLMLDIWDMDDIVEAICEPIRRRADMDGFDRVRELYNESRREW